MHRSAETAVEARGAREDLRKCAVEKEVDRKILHVALLILTSLDRAKRHAVKEFLHYVVKLSVVELLDRGKTLCENFAVAAVGAEREIVDIEAVRLTDRGRLLTDRKVSGTGVVVLDAVVDALYLDLVEHRLEFADDAHIAVNAEEILLGVNCFLFLEGLVVLTKRDRSEFGEPALKDLPGIYILTFRHCFISL